MHILELPQRIIYGIGSIEQLPIEAVAFGKKFSFFCGESSLKRSGFLDKILDSFDKYGLEIQVISGVTPEPNIHSIAELLNRVKNYNPHGIIAVGGGSVIDSAKIISALLTRNVNIFELRGKEIEDALPIIAVPTTAGTGSEATRFAVITDPEMRDKFLLSGKALIPKVALVDPELTFTMSPLVAVATGIDALSHAIESFLSRSSTPYTDIWAKEAIATLWHNLVPAINENSLPSKEKVSYAAFWAGVAINNAKTTLIHAMSRPLGGVYNVIHGIANGILLPAYLRYNAPFIPHEKMNFLKHLMGGYPPEKVENLLRELNFPLKLSQVIREKIDIQLLVDKAKTSQMNINNNIRPVKEEDIFALYEEVL
ncbi:MAG: iron-containing alcohol dehydrogenase [Dictyoglomaceae bacterium]|nr:iron-containing alcohol dehydrogenase [Dictyoglomaceae bacterium]